jgi:hypothetical protein
MHDFKYCLWLTSESTPWKTYTNGFQPHVTIKSHLSYNECLSLLKEITADFKPVEIELIGKIKYSSTTDFHSLFYDAKLKDDALNVSWWPENPHVSFFYDYDTIDDSVILDVSNKVIIKSVCFDSVIIKRCSGHFTKW